MIYTVTLNPAFDYVMRVEKLIYGEINRSHFAKLYCGGKGINVSVMLTRLGIANRALGFMAGFTGVEFTRMLEEDEGLSCDFIFTRNGITRINVKIRDGRELDVNAPGPEVEDDEIRVLYEKTDALQDGDILVLAGSVPGNMPSDIYETILSRLGNKNIGLVIDAAGDLLRRTLKFKPFLAKPNHQELGELFGVNADTPEVITECAQKLRSMGARNVLITRGGDGAMLFDETGGVYSVGVVPGKMLNTVGCGDSMTAGFLAEYLKSGDYERALRFGSACGTATAYSPGLAEPAFINEILEKTGK